MIEQLFMASGAEAVPCFFTVVGACIVMLPIMLTNMGDLLSAASRGNDLPAPYLPRHNRNKKLSDLI